MKVAEENAQGVADTAVGVAEAVEHFLGERDVVGEVDAADPQTHEIGAGFFHEVHGLRRLLVSALRGLRNFFAGVDIDDEAVGQARLVGRAAFDADGGHERGLEPASVLVGCFEVEVGGVLKFGTAAEDGLVTHAGIDPDVEGVVSFGRARGKSEHGSEFGVGHFEPRVGAAFFHQVGHPADEIGVEDRFAFRSVEDGQRHAPAALAADAPVGAGFHRAGDALEAPVGNPLGIVDCLYCIGAQVVDADEELLDGAEDDGRFGTPAVRIRMLVGRDAVCRSIRRHRIRR